MSIFTWTPDYNATKSSKPQVTTIKFGDGYSQRVAYGINTMPQSWSLTFSNRSSEEIAEIESFLNSLGGVYSFEWTPPGSQTSAKFICQEWTKTLVRFNLYSLSATFEEVFDL